jgi:wyosine [tRNA(Phe)-imidazoG37] synthetase (radical SAM superfamily)
VSDEHAGIVYGPVASRRLGVSLGVDPAPKLTCTFSCVYCQLGRIRHKVRGPEEVSEPFPAPDVIEQAVREVLQRRSGVDVVTLSGSGEPTLHPQLGAVVAALRAETDIPIALITNGSLLGRPAIANAAATCDLVLPSLDAGDQETFARINRPAPGFTIECIADAIGALARRTTVWLEVMLISSETMTTNVHPEAVAALAEKIGQIRPERVTLNTCVRPPAEDVDPASDDVLERIREQLEAAVPGVAMDIVPREAAVSSPSGVGVTLQAILDLLRVRPCTLMDVAEALDVHPAEVGKILRTLVQDGSVVRRLRGGRAFFVAGEDATPSGKA